MAHFAIRPAVSRAVAVLAAAGLGVTLVTAPHAEAGAPPEVVYLYNVTVRKPGYNFASADAALAYGYGICDKVDQGRKYAQVIGDVKAEFQISDEGQASYLIAHAVNELCPASIWQLRNSAAHYQPPTP